MHAHERVYDLVREKILDGAYSPGAHLVESDVAEELGASRTPIRAALQRLASEGLVELAPNRGARVARWSSSEIEEVYELRALLESHAAKKATPNVTTSGVVRLQELAAEMEGLVGRVSGDTDFRKIALLNNEFHAEILRASGSNNLTRIHSRLVDIPMMHQTFRRYSPEALRRSFMHHRELIEALKQRDALWAESIMRTHVLAGRVVLRETEDEPGEVNEYVGESVG